MFKKTAIALFAVLIGGCAQTPQIASYQLNIHVSEPDRVRFSGKGAGAGMMMSASMGPMGVAIGVAIDEGISKKIDAAARQSHFDVKALVHGCMQGTGQGEVTIQRYGFVLWPHTTEEEVVVPEWQVEYRSIDSKGDSKGGMGSQAVFVNYPADFKEAHNDTLGESIDVYAFERIKSDGDYVVLALEESLGKVCHRLVFRESTP